MIHCPRKLDGHLDHVLAANSVRIELALGLPHAGGEISWWRSDRDLQERQRERTIPDALFAIRWADFGEQVFALELEYETRAPRSFQRKLLRYAAAASRSVAIYGAISPMVLVVGRSSRWVERYRVALAPLALGIDVAFARLNEIEEHRASGDVWQTVIDENRYSLRSLAEWRYRKEGHASESACEANANAPAAAHKFPSSEH